MKPLKTKPKTTILLLFLLLSLAWCILPVFAQELEEEPLSGFKWYYCPRAFPFDTIPGGSTNRGVWLSTNNGVNWIQTALNYINVYSLTVSGSYLFAGGEVEQWGYI